MLVSVRQKLFRDDDLGIGAARHAFGIALRVVDARDLARLHRDRRALLQIDDGLRVQNALAAAFALAVVLFDVGHLRVFADVEGVDAVVLRVAAAAVVDAAARDDADLRALAYEKVVIDHIVKTALGQDDGDVYVFMLCKRLDADVDAVLVGLGDDLNVLGVVAVRLFAVGADVHRAFGHGRHVRHHAQDVLLYVCQHIPFTSSILQPVTVCVKICG